MKTERLTTSESIMLDVIRTIAAMVVAFGHLTQHYFSTGWVDRTRNAEEAVAVFFVLSGFVIRYVTCRNRGTLSHYLNDRASRIYSIAIPALLFTLLADTIARHVNPAFYHFWEASYHLPLLRILVNLLFCGQLWTHYVNPLSNSPFWSVNYEVAYYVLYACFYYLAGRKRWFWIIAICLFVGPQIIYLSPLWIAGALLHDYYQRWNASKTTSRNLKLLSALYLVLAIAGFAMRHQALWVVRHLLPPQLHMFLYATRIGPEVYLFGILWILIFMMLLFFARQFSLDPKSRFVRAVHFISEGTFPIYLLHFPLYVLIAACFPYNHANPVSKLCLFLFVLVVGVLAGHPGNLFKIKLRSLSFFQRSTT